MARMKKVQVCFNLENQSQSDLFKNLSDLFGKNMSGGIRNILFAYFNGSGIPSRPQHSTTDMESVL